MELKYTPRTIRDIEKETGKPLQDLLSDFSMSTILLFVKGGLGSDEDTAYTEIEKYLAEGKDTFSLYTHIMEKLQESGFLPRALDLRKVQKQMDEAVK